MIEPGMNDEAPPTAVRERPASVLPYAPPPPVPRWRVLLPGLAIAMAMPCIAALLGLFIGNVVTPVEYTSIALLSLERNAVVTKPTVIAAALKPHVAALTDTAFLTQVANGAALSPSSVIAHTKVVAMPQSQLIVLSYTSRNSYEPRTALSAIVQAYTSKLNSVSPTIPVVAPPTVAAPHRSLLPRFIGSFAGAILGLIGAFAVAKRVRDRAASTS